MVPSRYKLLNVKPGELTFPFELKKRASCKLQLSNVTLVPVAFKVMTTNPDKYAVQPKDGIIWAGSTCDITVHMQAPKKALTEVECKDKFLIKNVVARADTTTENVRKLFTEPGNAGEDIKLRVKYVLPSQTESSNSERARAVAPMNTSSHRRPNHPQVIQAQGENKVPYGDLLQNVVKIGLLGLVVWFLITTLMPLIWSLMFFILMLGIKMINKLVSDSVEDWILKILCYMFGHFISSLFSSK